MFIMYVFFEIIIHAESDTVISLGLEFFFHTSAKAMTLIVLMMKKKCRCNFFIFTLDRKETNRVEQFDGLYYPY